MWGTLAALASVFTASVWVGCVLYGHHENRSDGSGNLVDIFSGTAGASFATGKDHWHGNFNSGEKAEAHALRFSGGAWPLGAVGCEERQCQGNRTPAFIPIWNSWPCPLYQKTSVFMYQVLNASPFRPPELNHLFPVVQGIHGCGFWGYSCSAG